MGRVRFSDPTRELLQKESSFLIARILQGRTDEQRRIRCQTNESWPRFMMVYFQESTFAANGQGARACVIDYAYGFSQLLPDGW
jgi:hypothetical protein